MNPRDFQRTFDTCRDPVFRFLWLLCRDRADAEDLLQDTFLQFWRKGDRHEGRGSVLAYLRQTAFHLYLNQRTKATRRADLAAASPSRERVSLDRAAPDTSASVAANDARQALLGQVRRAVDALPDGSREVFILHRFEGLSCREIAALIRVEPKTVESRLRRATQAVARALGGVTTNAPPHSS